MRVVLMTSRLAGLDRFPQLAELPLLITLGSVAYFGFIALFGRRTIFGHLTIARQAHERGAPALAKQGKEAVVGILEPGPVLRRGVSQ